MGLLAAAAAGPAGALTCPELSLREKLDGADVAFVGRIVAEPGPGSPLRRYRFVVDQPVKGGPPREVEVLAASLVDVNDKPVEPDVAVGVLATRTGGALVTSSCALVDPGGLLAEADEPKGGPIKLVIGVLILLAVVGYSLVRLKRRESRSAAGGGGGSGV